MKTTKPFILPRYSSSPNPTPSSHHATAILDSGASNHFLGPNVPLSHLHHNAPPLSVRTADGTTHQSNTTATIHLDTTPPLTASGYVIPNFPHTLLSVGKIVDENCRVLFDNHKVSVLNNSNRPILTGWREASGSRLWRLPITENPNPQTSPSPTHIATNAYTIPTTKELIAYYHAAAGYPVKSTWLAAIKAGNYATWPGLTTTRVSKHYPDTIATPKGHMISTRTDPPQ